MSFKTFWIAAFLMATLPSCAKQVDLYEYAGLVESKPEPPPSATFTAEEQQEVPSIVTLYNKGLEELREESYTAALKSFEEVERVHPYSGWASRAILMQAYIQYLRNEYDASLMISQRFIQTHPGHRDVGYAHYLVAMTYYEQISDVRRDQMKTRQALDALQRIVDRFPATPYARDAALKITEVNNHLAGQEMVIGRYYLGEQSYLAAVNRFKTVIEVYPTTTQAPEALYRLVEAYLALGIIHEAEMAGRSLEAKYPHSEWTRDARTLLASKGLAPKAHSGSWMARIFTDL